MLTTPEIICFAIILLCLIVIFVDIVFDKRAGDNCVIPIAYVIAIAALVAGASFSAKANSKRPREFPAEKYELKCKVSEMDGQTDTTYVIVPKEF